MTFAPSPAELGYRLPAEWEPHAATWLAWPHRQATWLGDFSPIPHVFENVARLLALREPVKIIGFTITGTTDGIQSEGGSLIVKNNILFSYNS